MKIAIHWMLSASILVGCGPAAGPISGPNETSRLDRCRQQAPEFVDSVKKFYQAIQDKDWPTSYDMRTADFKQDVTRDFYLGQMAKDRPRLNSYKVLSIQTFGDGAGYKAAQIVMEFNHGSSYGCARWKKVVGVWLCEEPGFSGLLTSTRIPDWVSH